MRRRVIQIAESTQLISLPRKWCLGHNLKKGDELEVEEAGARLIVSTEKDPAEESVEVNVSDLDRTSVIDIIRGLYKKGYDEIKVICEKPVTRHFRTDADVNISSVIHKEVSRCPGLEVIEQREGYCLLKVISKAEPKELDNILRRTFILISDTCKDLITAAKNNDRVLLESIEEKHDNATRFISHCLRLINKRHNETKNTHFLYQIISMLDKIVDILKSAARDMLRYDKKIQQESYKILELIYESYEVFHELFYKFNLEKVRRMSELKEKTHRAILQSMKNIPKEEMLLLYDMHESLEIYKALKEARMSMEF